MPVLKASVQVSGTVAWELETIKAYKLDEANGFTLEIQDVAGSPGAQIALQAGETDMIVSDWLVGGARAVRGPGRRLHPVFQGGRRPDGQGGQPGPEPRRPQGKKIGIAGGPIDKSWLILRAYAQKENGMDLAAETEQVFGAPPLIFKAELSGEVDGAINFWHFGAKMEAAGMRTVVTVAEAATALGTRTPTRRFWATWCAARS